MPTVRQGPIRRVFASLMLAGLALSYATPLLAGASAAGCPLSPTEQGVPALQAAMDGGSCEHTDAAPCVSTLGCIASAPAIQGSGVAFVIPVSVIVPGGVSASLLGDLFGTGPPTPPPNLI